MSLSPRAHPPTSGSPINANRFVEVTLTYVLTYITSVAPSRRRTPFSLDPVQLTILADNDYYSQPHSTAAAAETNPSRFAKFPTALQDAHKTGLGSSAALVTALTAALLTHFLPREVFDVDSADGRRVLHNLAQAAHCAAQGKVGSGFDVAAAVYGSCRYRRFSPALLEGLPEPGAAGFAPALVELVARSAAWDTEIATDAVRLPPGLAVRMCDVDCGSQTVGMVKQVLAWRAAAPDDARALWDALQADNEALAAALAAGDVDKLPTALAAVRARVRAMGAASAVPIEPETQTALLDALTATVDGVLGGVVPGAGGFDALALLVRDDAETEAQIQDFVAAWAQEHGGSVRLLAVKGEMEGIRKETLDQYAGWINN